MAKPIFSLHIAICAVLACACTIFSCDAVPFSFEYSIGILPLFVAVSFFFLFRRFLFDALAAMRRSVRMSIVAVILALLFSAMLIFGSRLIFGNLPEFTPFNVAAIFVCAIPILIGFVALNNWMDRLSLKIERRSSSLSCSEKQDDNKQRRRKQYSCKQFLSRFGILLICWLPIFLAAFPGFFAYDMTVGDYTEISQFENGEFSNHHSFLHTLLIGFACSLSENLTGSYNPGIAVFVSIQAIIIALIFAYMLKVIRLQSGSRGLEIASLVYLTLDPTISMFVMCTTKDTLFSAACAMLIALIVSRYMRQDRIKHSDDERVFIESCRDKQTLARQIDSQHLQKQKPTRLSKYPGDISSLVAIVACGFFVAILRPNGIYAVVLLVPFLIAFEGRGMRLKMLASCVAMLSCVALWLGPISWACGVENSELQRLNAMSIPAQQIAYVVTNEQLSDTEADMLVSSNYGVLADEGSKSHLYYSSNADSTRNNLSQMSLSDILKVYVSLGLAYPEDYLYAFLDHTQPAWNPYCFTKVYGGGVYTERETALFACDWEEPASSQSLFPVLLDVLEEISGYLILQNIPLLALLVAIPFYFWVMLFMVARAIITWDRRIVVPCALLTVIVLTALIAPVTVFRYYLPIVFSLPLIVLACTVVRSRGKGAFLKGIETSGDSVKGNGAINGWQRATGHERTIIYIDDSHPSIIFISDFANKHQND